MSERHWQHALLSLILFGSLTPAVIAQPAVSGSGAMSGLHRSSGRGGFGFMASMDKAVGFSAEQRDAVHGLLAQQREEAQSLREGTDQKIRALLNPEQQKKFDAFLVEQKAARAHRFAHS